ncbi:hypothetical protein BHM03_00020600 [Ensete ventricosum]|nr:hypothetical protein BHM03_00020600 [Ensete ventricosum]
MSIGQAEYDWEIIVERRLPHEEVIDLLEEENIIMLEARDHSLDDPCPSASSHLCLIFSINEARHLGVKLKGLHLG